MMTHRERENRDKVVEEDVSLSDVQTNDHVGVYLHGGRLYHGDVRVVSKSILKIRRQHNASIFDTLGNALLVGYLFDVGRIVSMKPSEIHHIRRYRLKQ